MIRLNFNSVSRSNGSADLPSAKNPVATTGAHAFSMVSTRAMSMARGVMEHPVFTSLRKYLPESPINQFSGLVALGLLSGCDGTTTALIISEIAMGVSFLAGAGWLVKRNILDVPRHVAQIKSDQEQIKNFQKMIKSDEELKVTATEKPDVTVEILTLVQKEVVARVAACSTAKLDMDALIRLVEKKISEGLALGVSRDSEAMEVLDRIQHDAETRNEDLRQAVTDLVMQSHVLADWMDSEMQRASGKKTLNTWLFEVSKLAGKAVTAQRSADRVLAETESLTAEIMHTKDVLAQSASYVEVDAWKKLDSVRLLTQNAIRNWEEQLIQTRTELELETVEADHG